MAVVQEIKCPVGYDFFHPVFPFHCNGSIMRFIGTDSDCQYSFFVADLLRISGEKLSQRVNQSPIIILCQGSNMSDPENTVF